MKDHQQVLLTQEGEGEEQWTPAGSLCHSHFLSRRSFTLLHSKLIAQLRRLQPVRSRRLFFFASLLHQIFPGPSHLLQLISQDPRSTGTPRALPFSFAPSDQVAIATTSLQTPHQSTCQFHSPSFCHFGTRS